MKKIKKITIIKIVVIGFLLLNVIGPLVVMVANMFNSGFGSIYQSPLFKQSLSNSLWYTSRATVLSIAIAYTLAYFIMRSNIKYKKLLIVLITLPMLIPSISHGIGLVILLGNNGIINNVFNTKISIYGNLGLVFGSVMYSLPIAFLMFIDILRFQDETLYESANILGIPKIRQFTSITFPFLIKPLISVVLITFTMIFSDYGVPMMVGGTVNTLPILMYGEVIGLLNYNTGLAIGLVLLVPALISFVVDTLVKDSGNNSITKEVVIKDNKVRDIIAYIVIGIVTILIVMPSVSFLFITFIEKYPTSIKFSISSITKALDSNIMKYLFNSLIIALFTALIGTIITYFAAYFTSRSKGKTNKFIHLVSLATLSVPGILLGLAYVLFFKSTFIYGTLVILIMVNIVHFFGSPYLLAYNVFTKIDMNYEDVAETIGVSRLNLIKNVMIPTTKKTIIEMFTYLFVNAMITISAVSFLATSDTKPLSMLINEFEASFMIESAAFISLLILVINLALKAIFYFIGKDKKNDIIEKSV